MIKRKEDALTTVETIGRSGLEWSDLTMQHESLEDVFVRLVGKPIESEDQMVAAK